MLERKLIEQQLAYPLDTIDIPGLGEKYEGKVRDCYTVPGPDGNRRILIASDRLSAFDVVLSTIPFKGQMLSQMALYWFDQTKHIVPNHIISSPHPNVAVTREVKILPIEIIVRGYITGSAWRDYQSGKPISGIKLPIGMKKSQKFDEPIITPSTKAERGLHDEPISSEDVVGQGHVEQKVWEKACDIAMKLFQFGTEKAAERGLILVDTKYEMGLLTRPGQSPELILADEVHTPDSSRYWKAATYNERFAAGEEPDMLDKEFVRGWLIEQGYMGEGTPPKFTDEFRVDTALRYMELFEKVTGQKFTAEVGPVKEAVAKAVTQSIA